MRWKALAIVGVLFAAACTPGDGPGSIPLPTSGDTTTTSTSTTTTTTTTTTTLVPPRLQVTIRRTTDGVPHIIGNDLESVAYGQGFVSAQDHGCTLVDQILKVYGVRSENLGPGDNGRNTESDFAWRAIDIASIATDDYNDASSDVVTQFEAFAEGWNALLADRGDDGLTGWCNGAAWVRPVQPVEVYVYARSLALNASSSRFTDFIPSAQPPVTAKVVGFAPTDPPEDADDPTPDFSVLEPVDVGSNGWAVGKERTGSGTGGLLVANPHFPWEGELRFAEVHLTVPGEIDIYGAQLLGLPGIAIGFTDGVAWTHTVSAGKRMTAYLLTLDPESPTSYLVDGESRPMTSTDYIISILRADGSIDNETRTLWRSEYGPIIDFPGLGWTDSSVLSFRDANINNNEFIEQQQDMIGVQSLDDLQAAYEEHQGGTFVNTIATGADGRVWYADTAATPNLSAEGEQLFVDKLSTDPITQIAYGNGVVLLDGADSRLAWETVPGARDNGLVPFSELPMVERNDYVFNANDSFWVSSDEFTTTGAFSILHGEQNTPLSMRTRQNAAVLSSDNRLRLAGDDGNFSGLELRDAVFDNRSQTALLLRSNAVDRCVADPLIEVVNIFDDDETVALPAELVDISAACNVLSVWDGRYDLTSSGPLLWREAMRRFTDADRTTTGVLFGDEFDPARPTLTPGVPATPAAIGNDDPLLQAIARAVQTLTKAGFAVDASLGAAQFTERSGIRIPLHGGDFSDGVTNVVQWSDGYNSSSEPSLARGEAVAPNSALRGKGAPVNFGSSFLLVVDYSGDNLQAWAITSYGQTGDRTSPLFEQQTNRFSEKNWRDVAFTAKQIAADPNLTERTIVVP
ncbi:MAG: penicillin acylase family protein [Actinomycetota bacterium]|nr:penicillin acylase family protein [Actinomycetota bacterium]